MTTQQDLSVLIGLFSNGVFNTLFIPLFKKMDNS